MPNRYEREIEEILRNLEQAEPRQRLSQKAGERFRRRGGASGRPHQRSSFSLHLTVSEWLLVVVVGAALLAGGYAYASGAANVFTGIVALFSIVCLMLVMLSQFIFQPRRERSTAYRNVTQLRRGLFAGLRTRLSLFMLKMRYRRRNGK
jgi:hypothetical protein